MPQMWDNLFRGSMGKANLNKLCVSDICYCLHLSIHKKNMYFIWDTNMNLGVRITGMIISISFDWFNKHR